MNDKKLLEEINPNSTTTQETIVIPNYKVIFHNDEITTMDFVIEVIMSIFNKTEKAAHQLMLIIHHQGKAVVGIYNREIAETKLEQTKKLALINNFPLQVTLEKQ